jgi:hypothetical protein
VSGSGLVSWLTGTYLITGVVPPVVDRPTLVTPRAPVRKLLTLSEESVTPVYGLCACTFLHANRGLRAARWAQLLLMPC